MRCTVFTTYYLGTILFRVIILGNSRQRKKFKIARQLLQLVLTQTECRIYRERRHAFFVPLKHRQN